MIMRGTTPRALSSVGLFVIVALAVALLPLLPTWAQIERPQDPPADKKAPPPKRTHVDEGDSREEKSDLRVHGFIRDFEPVDFEPVDMRQVPMAPGSAVSPESIQNLRDEIELLELQRQIKQAQLRGTAAGTTRLKNKIQRAQQLVKNGSVSSTDVEDAMAELESQQAQIQVKEAELKEADVRLRQARRRLAELEGHKAPVPATGKPPSPRQHSESRNQSDEGAKARSEAVALCSQLELAKVEEDVARAKLKEVTKVLADTPEGTDSWEHARSAVSTWKDAFSRAVRARGELEEKIRELQSRAARIEETQRAIRR